MTDMRKLIDLVESPDIRVPAPPIDGTEPEPVKDKKVNGGMSRSALAREYHYLNSCSVTDIGDLLLFESKNKNVIVGVLPEDYSSDVERLTIVFHLVFHSELKFSNNPTFKIPNQFKNPRRVKWVFTDEDIRNRDIASVIYRAMADMGFSVFSDAIQYEPGYRLWKRISKDYTTSIVDLVTGKILKNNYNGSNLEDDKIWSRDPDKTLKHIALVLPTRRT